jgi:hypothetical protein
LSSLFLPLLIFVSSLFLPLQLLLPLCCKPWQTEIFEMVKEVYIMIARTKWIYQKCYNQTLIQR